MNYMVSKKFFTENRLDNSQQIFDLVMRLTCISMLFVFAYGWRRYVPNANIMPLVPLIDSFVHLPDVISWAALFLCSASFLFLLFVPQNRVAAWIIVCCMIFFVLQDFNRLQPFVFMYMFPVVIVSLFKKVEQHGVNALRFMVCGVYFWAGFHKLNLSFYTGVFPWFTSPLYRLFGEHPVLIIDILYGIMTFSTPFFELLIGVFLIFPKWRKVATFMASIMLATVLFCLGPFGHNWGHIVWPWNVYLFSLEYLLFFRTAREEKKSLLSEPFSKISILSIAVYVVAPVLAIFTHWYAYTGYKLYAGSTVFGNIILDPKETLKNSPDYIKKLVKADNTIDQLALFGAEGNGVPYPVPYVLKKLGTGLCKFLDYPEKTILRITYPAPFYQRKGTNEDSEICRE